MLFKRRGLRGCLLLLSSRDLLLLLRSRFCVGLIRGAAHDDMVELRVIIVDAGYFYDKGSDSLKRACGATLRHMCGREGRRGCWCGKWEVVERSCCGRGTGAASRTQKTCKRFACMDFVSGSARMNVHREPAMHYLIVNISVLSATGNLICSISEKKRLAGAPWRLASSLMVKTAV